MSRTEKRDCTHPQARHEHGTALAYVRDRCGCVACREAYRVAEEKRRRAHLYGRYDGLVDAEPARQHVRYLSTQGIGLKQITRVSGVGGGVLTKLMYGQPLADGTRRAPSRRVTPRVRDRILAVQPSTLAGGALVDATGTRRRLEALVVCGWSQSKIADQLGMARANFGKAIRAERVTASTARAVAALYDKLWSTPPPEDTHRDRIAASRARRMARDRGWVPPLAWDDDDLDNPDVQPWTSSDARAFDPIAVERIAAGTLRLNPWDRSPERVEAVRRLAALGFNDAQISVRVGMTAQAVGATRKRHGIPSASKGAA